MVIIKLYSSTKINICGIAVYFISDGALFTNRQRALFMSIARYVSIVVRVTFSLRFSYLYKYYLDN